MADIHVYVLCAFHIAKGFIFMCMSYVHFTLRKGLVQFITIETTALTNGDVEH